MSILVFQKQKQSFAVVLQNSWSLKLRKFHRKAPVIEPFFNKVTELGLQLYQTETLTQVFSCEICEILKNIFFTEHLQWLSLQKKLIRNFAVMIQKIKNMWKTLGK